MQTSVELRGQARLIVLPTALIKLDQMPRSVTLCQGIEKPVRVSIRKKGLHIGEALFACGMIVKVGKLLPDIC